MNDLFDLTEKCQDARERKEGGGYGSKNKEKPFDL